MREDLLSHVVERLDVLITLSLPPFDKKRCGFAGVKADVLQLCDYEHTAEDIAKELKKSRQHIDVALSWLRSKGYIKSVTKKGKIYYVRIKSYEHEKEETIQR